MNGLLAGLAIGALAGAAILFTGGAALPFIVAGAVAGAAAGGGIGEVIGTMSFMPLDISGAISTGSPNVMINGRPAAHAHLSTCSCSHHSSPILVAQGSSGVYINGKPASRKGDLTICSAKVAEGSPNVMIGGGTVTTDKISPEIPDWVNKTLLIAGFAATCVLAGPLVAVVGFAGGMLGGEIGQELGGAMFGKGSDGQKICGLLGSVIGGFGAAKMVEIPPEVPTPIEEGVTPPVEEPVAVDPAAPEPVASEPVASEPVSSEPSAPRPAQETTSGEQNPSDANPNPTCAGDPVDVISGQVRMSATDFILPGVLPVVFERTYCSGFEDASCLGPKWRSTWGAMILDSGTAVVSYVSADGLKLKFNLRGRRNRQGWHSNPLAPKIKLRRSRTGFEVLERDRTTLSFEQRVGKTLLLAEISHPNGHSIQFTRSHSGALVLVEHSGGYRLHVSGTASQIWQIFLELSNGSQQRLVAYQYDERGNLSGIVNGSNLPLTYTYDELDRIVRWTDRQGTWYGYTYDEKGRVVQVDGAFDVFSGVFHYDETERLTTFTDSHGHTSTYHYDDTHHVIEYRNALGATTRTIWNRAGQKTAEIDPNGNLTAFEYDPEGNLLTQADPAGNSTHFTYNELGLPNSVIDAAGNAWLRDYDERGNLLAAGLTRKPLWRYERDFAGNLTRITDPEGRTRAFTYDSRGLPLAVTDALGHSTTFQRDDFGRIIVETNALGHTTQYRYNELQKLSDVIRPDGSRIHWDYNPEGLVTRRVAADGATYTYSYGAFDKLAELAKPSGDGFRFAYDLETRARAIQNERGEVYSFEHDVVGRVIRETDFTGRTIEYEYDLAGFCIKRTNGAGETTVYTRDGVGRVTQKEHSDGSSESFTYDRLGNLLTASNSATTLRFERDAYGRILREQQGEFTLHHTYDAGGLRTALRTSTGVEAGFRYDANCRLTALQLPGEQLLEFELDALGRETARHFGHDFVLLQNYDSRDRLTHQQGGPIERAIDYDIVSNPVAVHDRKWGTSRFTYDADGRLAAAHRDNGLSEDFEYDPAGEIKTTIRRDQPLAHAKFKTRLLSYGGRLELIDNVKYFYDRDGRVTEKWDGRKIWKYEWSVEGRLLSVLTPNGQRWTYDYDPLGRRIRKTGPPGTTSFLWDGATIAEIIGHDGHTAAWFYQPGTFRPIAKLDQTAAYACVTDQIGTPRELVSKEGKVAWSIQLSAFGETEKGTPDATVRCNLRFQGQYRDEETGLHYNFQRYYEPQTGRYLSPDPIGLEGGARSYGYVHNPLAWVDPWGLAGCANVDDNGVLNLRNKFDPGSAEDQALQQHVADWNQSIADNGGSMTRQAVTPAMRAQADVAAANARAADPALYPNNSVAAGHTPDVGWGGNPEGPINPLNSTVNSYVGGATQAVPVGTTYNSVVLYR